MIGYSLRRIGQLILMLFIASVVIFAVIQNSPGDPALMRLGLEATPAQVEIERERLGLNRSLPERYLIWLGDAVRLDLGRSFSTGLPVVEMIGDAFLYTARLAGLATLFALPAGLLLGIVSAIYRGRRIDQGISVLAAAAFSLPSFALGTLFIVVFSVLLHWLPAAGAGMSGQSPLDALRFMLMPALTLAIPFAVVLTRFVRVALIEAMAQDYVVTARAKGLHRWAVIGHGLRNALIPTITVTGLQVGALLAGATVVETVFSYPGLGRLTIEAVQGLDYPLVQAALLLAAFIFLVNTFLVDIAYGLIDPRVRLRGAR